MTKSALCKKTAALFFFLFALGTSVAYAAADFYGIKMKSEDFAQNIQLKENNLVPDFSASRPGTDKRVYAYAYVSGTVGGGKGVSIQVYNHSDGPFATDRLFREMALVTWSGTRYDRSETEMMRNRDSLGPGEDATFNFTFPGIRVPKEEIRMIVCSFDMGGTMIILFPLKTEPAQAVPAAKQGKFSDLFGGGEPKKKTTKAPVPKKAVEEPAETEQTPKEMSADSCYVTPVKAVQSVFQKFGGLFQRNKKEGPEPIAEEEVLPSTTSREDGPAGAVTPETFDQDDHDVPPSYPLVKASQVIEGTKYNFLPAFKRQVEEAEGQMREVVHRDRPWSLGNPDKEFVRKEKMDPITPLPRGEAKVVHVNLEYGFVVVNAGYEDGLDKSRILEVLRNGRKVGKVMVTKPREKISGAIILPEWRTRDEIQTGDLVGVSP